MDETMKSLLTKNQKQTFTKSNIKIDGENVDVIAKVRYDDQCGNGHNSFAITGEVYKAGRRGDRNMICCGCVHEYIEAAFPELKPFIKWHLTSSDGPMHYIANTMYHARDTDYNGLKNGEYSAYTLELVADCSTDDEGTVLYTSGQIYTNKQNNPNLAASNNKEIANIEYEQGKVLPKLNPRIIKKFSAWSISEGKEIDLKAARSCAIWPNATLEQLQDEEVLKARLPDLITEFKKDIESLGMVF